MSTFDQYESCVLQTKLVQIANVWHVYKQMWFGLADGEGFRPKHSSPSIKVELIEQQTTDDNKHFI